jgi:hypothetical protein
MVSRRMVMVALTAALGLSVNAAPAAAATPAQPPTPAGAPAGERPLTAAEQALSDAKVARADAYLARLHTSGFGLVTLACVPNIAPPGAPRSLPDAKGAPPPKLAASCAPPSGFLPVEARQQTKNHYCGPAVGQVVSNYAWVMNAGANKFAQNVIAGWMKTDVSGQTSAPELVAGLHKGTFGSPRHKAEFRWAITNLEDTDGDGTTGDQLHGYLMSAISGAKMPVAIALKPHEPGAADFLASWPDPIRSSGHWIAAYGWSALWSASARTYYADSSENQGGGTGKYWDPTAEIARLIGRHTGRIVW